MGARVTVSAGDLVTLAIVAAGAWGVWQAIKAATAGAEAVGQWASEAGETVQQAGRDWVAGGQAATGQIQDVFAGAQGWVVSLLEPAPSVPVGGASVQRRSATDLPEGSYQAPAMFWSLYPDAVFYD